MRFLQLLEQGDPSVIELNPNAELLTQMAEQMSAGLGSLDSTTPTIKLVYHPRAGFAFFDGTRCSHMAAASELVGRFDMPDEMDYDERDFRDEEIPYEYDELGELGVASCIMGGWVPGDDHVEIFYHPVTSRFKTRALPEFTREQHERLAAARAQLHGLVDVASQYRYQ